MKRDDIIYLTVGDYEDIKEKADKWDKIAEHDVSYQDQVWHKENIGKFMDKHLQLEAQVKELNSENQDLKYQRVDLINKTRELQKYKDENKELKEELRELECPLCNNPIRDVVNSSHTILCKGGHEFVSITELQKYKQFAESVKEWLKQEQDYDEKFLSKEQLRRKLNLIRTLKQLIEEIEK